MIIVLAATSFAAVCAALTIAKQRPPKVTPALVRTDRTIRVYRSR